MDVSRDSAPAASGAGTGTGPEAAPAAALPALATSPSFIFFTDFDGTITWQDSNDFMTDNLGFGPELRRQYGQDVLHGRRTFRDAFRAELDSVRAPLPECIDLLRRSITLDPGFRDFYHWCKANNVPVVVISGGMGTIVRAMLAHLLGEEEAAELPIVSNEVRAREGKRVDEEGGWEIAYRDER